MNLNTEDKKKAAYRASGLLRIPKDVVILLFGLFVSFTMDLKIGAILLALGGFCLYLDIHFLKMGKDEKRNRNE